MLPRLPAADLTQGHLLLPSLGAGLAPRLPPHQALRAAVDTSSSASLALSGADDRREGVQCGLWGTAGKDYERLPPLRYPGMVLVE